MEQSRLNSHLNKQNAKIMKEKIADIYEKIEELMNRPVAEPMPAIEIPAGVDFDLNQLTSMFATK